jgi:ribose transport system substrate-binding protein
VLTGEVAMEAAVRLLGKQALPRVVSTPQALITKDNVESFAVKGEELRKVLLSQPAG